MEYLPTGMNDFVAMYLGSPVPIYIMVAIAAYFLGCFNGAVIVSKYILRNDIRNHGSGNAGLPTFHRVFGGGLTFVVILCDVLKAVLAVLIGSGLFGLCLENAVLGKYWAGLFCLLGHMFPCMFQFKGGKGILCSGTLLLLLDWRIALVCWSLFAVLWLTTRYVSLGSVCGSLIAPIGVLAACGKLPALLSLFCVILLIVKHRSNIRRLIQHKESKLSFQKDLSDKFDDEDF